MKDKYGRDIDYVRISVTDRCNLRCRYCMPEEGVVNISHSDVLTYEEIEETAAALSKLGIKHIKITGGEPLVRRNLPELIKKLKDVPGICDVTLTTNGILLSQYALALWEAGIDGINISLDTLRPEIYKQITGVDGFYQVLDGISSVLELNIPTKINVVCMEEYNLEEVAELAGMAYRRPIDVRFIELMPLGLGAGFKSFSKDTALGILTEIFGTPRLLEKKCDVIGNGPAVYYLFPDFKGRIGFISPMSHKFCKDCNKIRITSEGMLQTCLGFSDGLDIRGLLRKTEEQGGRRGNVQEGRQLERQQDKHLEGQFKQQENKPEENACLCERGGNEEAKLLETEMDGLLAAEIKQAVFNKHKEHHFSGEVDAEKVNEFSEDKEMWKIGG